MTCAFAYARLFRLPNVFTAIADVSVGLVVAWRDQSIFSLINLPLASACLYCAGMAWNDYFDRSIDARERPERPIPSGTIAPATANWLAPILATLGVLFAVVAGWRNGSWTAGPVVHAVVLVALILVYDGWLKHSALGPVCMGGCRFANMLLGFSTASVSTAPWSIRLLAASILSIYVVGITFFARDEAGTSQKNRMMAGFVLILTAAILPAIVPTIAMYPASSWVVYFVTGFVLLLLNQANAPLRHPLPAYVQRFVKIALFCIILLDACLALAIAGPIGLIVVIWFLPALLIGRWIYST